MAAHDVQTYLVLLTQKFAELFKDRLPYSARTYANELRDYRNDWAHMKPFTVDDAHRALDTAERLLELVGAVQEAKQVRVLKLEPGAAGYEQAERRGRQVGPAGDRPAIPVRPVGAGISEGARGDAFAEGRAYTRDEIHDALGGSKQTYLPTVGGEVVAVCVGTAKNPQAPDRILVGTKPRVMAAADQLVEQPGAVPVFLKRRSNEWVYQGRYAVAEVCRDAGRLAAAARAAGRDELHMWIDLERAD